MVIYTPDWTHIPAAIATALGFGAWGWWGFRQSGFSTFVIARWMMAMLAALFWLPQVLTDELRVDDEHMQWQVGVWWQPEKRSIRFNAVSSVHVVGKKGWKRRHTIWVLRMVDGSMQEVGVTDLWNDHYGEIEARFRAKGIPITQDPDFPRRK